MPNLRGKTWTTTTPANVGDAQYWEDHLISDAVAAKAASSVQSVNNTTPDAQGNVDIVALPDGGTVGQVLTKQSSADGDADWEDPASSGHTIEDEDGNTMPYQETLQFVSAEVTNDTVNGKTVVDCKGAKGDAATITVGTVTTLPAGSQATVVNSGTSGAAVFDFGIPKGVDGSGSGDMTKDEYATNGEAGVVDEAVTLKGLTASIADLNKTSTLATVATSGSYNDLTNKPTAGTGIAINNNVIAVDADNTPTEGSEKPVKSKGVYSALESVEEEIEQIYADNGVLGAKNLLPNNATSQTINGVTFTVNDDKSVTVSGTASANTTYVMKRKTPLTAGKTYIFSRGIAGDNDFQLVATAWNSGTYVKNIIEIGAGDYTEKLFTPDYDGYDDIQISIFIRSGKSLSNAVVYPMLRLASDPDDTYVPYAMTNRELTEEMTVKESAVTDIVEGATVGSDYGNHLIKKGNIVQLSLRLTEVTVQQWKTVICRIPEGYRPKYRTAFRDVTAGKYLYCMPSGIIQSGATNFSNTELLISATWITD